MKRRLAALSILLFVTCATSQKPASNGLVRLGGISAENGEFALSDELITAYSDGDVWVESGAGQRELLQYKGGPVSFEIQNGTLGRAQQNPPLTLAHEFQFCDRLDQVSLSYEKGIVAVLPEGAKVKSTEDLIDGRTFVVYTVPGREHYAIMVALLRADRAQIYALLESDEVTTFGDYCGKQAMAQGIRAILVDEPAGSSDSSTVYFFALKSMTLRLPEPTSNTR
ncbi:MAG: hypothetical protein ACLQG3_06985 [Terracidiphilus sp.]